MAPQTGGGERDSVRCEDNINEKGNMSGTKTN